MNKRVIFIVILCLTGLGSDKKTWAQPRDSGRTREGASAEIPTITTSAYLKNSLQYWMEEGKSKIKEGQYDHALSLYQKAAFYANQQRENQPYLPQIYNHIGSIYTFKGDYATATRYLFLSIASTHNMKDATPHLIRAYNNLSVIFNRQGQNNKALYYLDEAEILANTQQYERFLPSILINKGRIYKESGEWAKSEASFQKVLQRVEMVPNEHLSQQTGMSRQEIRQIAMLNIGQLLYNQKKYKSALTYLHSSEIDTTYATPYYQIAALLTVGRIYYETGAYKKAEQYLLRGLEQSKKTPTSDGQYESYRALSELYAKTGRYEEAYKYRLWENDVADSLRNSQKTRASDLLEIKYRTAQKDKSIIEKELNVSRQKQQLKQKNLWIMGISSSAIFLAMFAFSRYKSLQQRQLLQEQKVRTLESDQKLKLMQASIEGEEKERSRIAHDLHDGIGGIISAAKMNFSSLHTQEKDQKIYDKVMNLLNDAAYELRSTAHNLMPEMLLQEGILPAIKTFCDRVSNHESLMIECQVYGQFTPLNKNFELLLYRTVQELINNVLKHAIASKVLVQLSMRNDLLTLTVEDNGKGMTTSKIPKGNGLYNLKEKVRLLNGQMSISGAEGRGTQIYIEFDLPSLYTKMEII